MSRLPLKPTVIKRLFAASKNKCAYPGCKNVIVDEFGTVIGEICHIEAAEEGGERYNTDSNDEYRRSFDNLILMCSNHHKRTNNVIEYTSEKLKLFKSEHESGDYSISDNIVEQANKKYMEQNNTNTSSGAQFNNQAATQNIGAQIGSQIIHNYSPEGDKPFIDGARKVDKRLQSLIASNTKPGSEPEKTVIDFKNELQDKTPRKIVTIDTKFLKFRKENGRIKADVESYEKTNDLIIDECDDATQLLLKSFLIKNDPEKNDELKKSLIQKGQREPAIITCDGFLINGNRRKMALEELFLEKNQDSRFQMMRVVVLEEGATELDIQKLENRLQLQSEGKSEYQGLNRALTIRANERKGFTLEAQLRDDPNYHTKEPKEFNKVVVEFRKKFLQPLECIDNYLNLFDRSGLYNTISEGSGDSEGRWQAFIDYSNFYHGTLTNKIKQLELGIKDTEVKKIEDSVFKIIRKRNLRAKDIEIGKVHEFVRKLPKYLKNQESKKFLLKISDEVSEDIPEELKYNKEGERYSERDIDERWGEHFKTGILGNLIQAHKIITNQDERDKPLELLDDALKKLRHNNLKIENMDVAYYDQAMELASNISSEAEAIYQTIHKAKYELKKLIKKNK
jgi:hypothetical protein